MIFFKCLDYMDCGKTMTYLLDDKSCNLCGAPCEILNDLNLPVEALDSGDPTALLLGRAEDETTRIARLREEDEVHKDISEQMDGLSLEMPTERASVEGSSSNSPHSTLQDTSQGMDVLRADLPPPAALPELSQRPLVWMPDGVFGNTEMQQGFSPELDLPHKPAWPSIYMRTTGPQKIDISSAVPGSELNAHIDGASQRTTRIGERALAFPHIGEPLPADTNVAQNNFPVLGEPSHDENDNHVLASEAVPCQTETIPSPQDADLGPAAEVEKPEDDEKNEKKRKAKAKKKARKERKQAEAAAAEQAAKKPAALKSQLNTPSAPNVTLEKPEPIVPRSPTQSAWNAVLQKGRFTKETSMKGRKAVNASSYLVREADEDEENEVTRAIELRFNVGGAKHDSKRVVPRHAIV